MKICTLVLTAAAAAIAGCAAPRQINPQDAADATMLYECTGDVACTQAWRRAVAWVHKNSGYKVQSVTDYMLQTYNAPKYSLRWAMSLSREPIGNGRERITLSPNCGPVGACSQKPAEIVAAFNRHMRAPM